ncbi:MAG: hypothetical protein M1444_01430 [Patescibacteria group bacterium]|nr:hypothetical protein [Patescibacteria group bacterium]
MNLFPKIRIYSLKERKTLLSLILNLSLILLLFYPFFYPATANAAVTEGFVRFNRLSTGAAISGTACLKSTLTTQTNVVLVFPTGWTINSTASNWTISTTNLPTDPVGGGAATAWPGIGTATSVSGLSVTFPGTALAAGTFYCFNFTGASSTVGSAGNDQTGQLKTQGGAPYTDTVNYATSVVVSGAEQITVTASVSATMTFSLSANSIALGTLSTGSVTSGNVTQTVSTNARNGYVSWIQGTSSTGGTGGGLHSTSANADITSPSSFPTVTDLASATGVVVDADAGTNTPIINSGYNGTNTTSGGHFDGGTFHEVSSLTGAQSGTTVTLNVRAKIASTQAAATDYADTLTVVAAGSF